MPACDRCSNIKAKCVRDASQDKCERCRRLLLSCTFLKPAKPRGRRSHKSRTGTAGELVWVQNNTLPVMRNALEGLSPPEVDLLRAMTQVTDGPNPLAIAPSRFREVQVSIKTELERSPALLQRPLVTLWKAYGRLRMGQAVHNDTDVSRISDAMRSLRITELHDPELLASIFVLCRCLVDYELLYNGRSAHIIYRNVLTRLKQSPLYDASGSMLTHDGLSLVWMDAIESLLRRRVPALPCTFPDGNGYVDGFTGVAKTLLPLIYEICRLGAASNVEAVLFDQIKRNVTAWSPIYPTEEGLSEAEIILLCTHANMYKLTLLLILQQYQDTVPARTAEAADILQYARLSIQKVGYITPYSMMPLFIAGLELGLEDDQEKLLECMASIPSSAKHKPYIRMIDFMKHFWIRRREDSAASWLLLLDQMPAFNITP
ncbi:hypothetical protein PFICI_07799 [Pestalotiopsis fici W106-1]|uniref:Zn(2)-C6 fungal-type domain-containing protein n=1 Tax=Pestalotiopsis fici (strain W106-1 / CGMCC3.15140) TaxID=1229662 RepID=W3X2I7_PESFW|nr:uncharacterized protein PFICI_07799 [Pestalotiopsis fici W106-1]ETS80270.1 hypothetical protein PFICI_07799 [Pestalotiopsis fici W106-1]